MKPFKRLLSALVITVLLGSVLVYSNMKVSYKQLLVDGNMERTGVGDWSDILTTLTKETGGAESGKQTLKLTYLSSSDLLAGQSIITSSTTYRVTGWAVGDGNIAPAIRAPSGSDVWTGTTSTNAQRFDFTFTASSGVLYLANSVSTPASATHSVQFDDVFVTEYLPPTPISSLYNGLTLWLPLTDTWLQSTTLPSDRINDNHASVANGTPTYSSNGVELNGTTDNLKFPATGIFNSDLITIAVRFTPDFATDVNLNNYLYDATAGKRYMTIKYSGGLSNALGIKLGDTTIEDIPEATYSPFWNVNEENILIITGDDTNNLTNAWLNGNQILTNDTTAWTLANPENFWVGSALNDTGFFDGEIKNLRVYNRLLTAGERAQLENMVDTNPKIFSLYNGLTFWSPLTPEWRQSPTLASERINDNHASSVGGTPTYSSNGIVLNGTTDFITFPSTGVFNSTDISFVIKFTPDFAHDENLQRFFYANTGVDDGIRKQNNASLNKLRIGIGGTLIANILEETYSPYWNIGQENTLIVSATSGSTDAWLNDNQILTNDNTAFTTTDQASFNIGADKVGTNNFDGTISHFRIYNHTLTDYEVTQLTNSKF